MVQDLPAGVVPFYRRRFGLPEERAATILARLCTFLWRAGSSAFEGRRNQTDVALEANGDLYAVDAIMVVDNGLLLLWSLNPDLKTRHFPVILDGGRHRLHRLETYGHRRDFTGWTYTASVFTAYAEFQVCILC